MPHHWAKTASPTMILVMSTIIILLRGCGEGGREGGREGEREGGREGEGEGGVTEQ